MQGAQESSGQVALVFGSHTVEKLMDRLVYQAYVAVLRI